MNDEGKLIYTTEIQPDCPDICFAGERGYDCYCQTCTKFKAVEESIFEPRNFASEYTANTSRSNDLSLADASGIYVTGGTPWSLEPEQTTSYPILLFPARVLRNLCPRHTRLCQPRIAALQYLHVCHRVGILEDLSHLTCQVDTKIFQFMLRILETFL